MGILDHGYVRTHKWLRAEVDYRYGRSTDTYLQFGPGETSDFS